MIKSLLMDVNGGCNRLVANQHLAGGGSLQSLVSSRMVWAKSTSSSAVWFHPASGRTQPDSRWRCAPLAGHFIGWYKPTWNPSGELWTGGAVGMFAECFKLAETLLLTWSQINDPYPNSHGWWVDIQNHMVYSWWHPYDWTFGVPMNAWKF